MSITSLTDPQARRQDYLARLRHIIGASTACTGDYPTAIEGVGLFRRDEPAPPVICMVPPSLVLVASGAKRMWVGGSAYPYDTASFLVTSLNIPANSEVTEASRSQPCLGMTLRLDQRLLAELISQGNLPPPPVQRARTGVGLGSATAAILAPFCRLAELLTEPEAIPVLAPLIQREIHYRLLLSDQAAILRQIAAVDGHGYRISKAIDWLKQNYPSPLRVEELASRVQMSVPTFHQHFRQLSGMSPLQYQKWLRLNEARRLMLNEYLDVASAAFRVGYESPSQFSREYSRLFGNPPRRDIASHRVQAG
ncbi:MULTISPECIES: AraC family transcriptional regulator [Pantoea]|uniref:AraC family transcriptional regulator n=1 Tax=Pantoea TaxID=53335 RepID=UPI001F3FC6B9|nr:MULTISPECIES: AraC family transcriptional regulator [Pantoea]UIL54500.1 AraC family transcriptional regulator [Pantoea agglomerans]